MSHIGRAKSCKKSVALYLSPGFLVSKNIYYGKTVFGLFVFTFNIDLMVFLVFQNTTDLGLGASQIKVFTRLKVNE
jgi:hypothetical protein